MSSIQLNDQQIEEYADYVFWDLVRARDPEKVKDLLVNNRNLLKAGLLDLNKGFEFRKNQRSLLSLHSNQYDTTKDKQVQSAIVRALLEAGANVYSSGDNPYGMDAMFFALRDKNTAICNSLLEFGYDVKSKRYGTHSYPYNKDDEPNALVWSLGCCSEGDIDMAKVLVGKGKIEVDAKVLDIVRSRIKRCEAKKSSRYEAEKSSYELWQREEKKKMLEEEMKRHANLMEYLEKCHRDASTSSATGGNGKQDEDDNEDTARKRNNTVV